MQKKSELQKWGITAIPLFWKLDNSSVITRQSEVALAAPVLQCKNPAVEGRGYEQLFSFSFPVESGGTPHPCVR